MRKKKILLTFSKSRNGKLRSYTFNIYCAYWLLQYKAMIFYKCSLQDGTVKRLPGVHLAGCWRTAACFSISTVPCKHDRLSMCVRGRLGALELEQAQRSQTVAVRVFLVASFWWGVGGLTKWRGDWGPWKHGTDPERGSRIAEIQSRDIGSRSRAAGISEKDEPRGNPVSNVRTAMGAPAFFCANSG